MTSPLYQWTQSFWNVFTWYLEMIVKSAALSSNQAVGVKKSLRFEVQVLQTLNRALYEDFFFFKFVEFFFLLMFVWRPWIGKSVCSNWSQVGKDKMVVVNLWWNVFMPVWVESFQIHTLWSSTSRMYPLVGPSTATLNLMPCWITHISFGSTWNVKCKK